MEYKTLLYIHPFLLLIGKWLFSKIIITITKHGENQGESFTYEEMNERIYTHIIIRQF